ncbi:neutral alpha-glucosidase C-like [Onthophagus taurus]|uniref:neutral alpha-glucosidase C-like n=1 Tax=Onthophagus taurus TaxID=166361 RepID=UPI0039BDA4BC
MKSILFFLFIYHLIINSICDVPTCDSQPFCKEIRDGTQKSSFTVNEYTLIDGVLVLNATNNLGIFFEMKIFMLEGGMIRVKLEDPSNPRYDLKTVLNQEPNLRMGKIDFESRDYLIFSGIGGEEEIHVYFNPLELEVYKLIKNTYEMILKINDNQMLNFNVEDSNKAVSLDFNFIHAQVAYGIPQHAEQLSLQNTINGEDKNPYRLFNNDFCCYPIGTKEALYGSIPVLYAHGTELTSGVFWLNSAQTFVDINPNNTLKSLFISQTGSLDFFVLTGPNLKETILQYTSLTGSAPLPPLFSLGHHQSRWSYMSQEDALGVVEEMDRNDFPFDVIWLDIDYLQDYKIFTWNLETFPNPIGMQEEIGRSGRKLVLIIDPHVKREEGYFVFDVATENGYFVMDKNGDDFQGACWPGKSSWFDFLNPSAALYYSSLFTTFANTTDIVHIWNDMNEPSVFALSTNTMPDDNIHYGGVLHEEVHNIYGFSQTVNTHHGLLERYNHKKRPFVLTRSHFAGNQRFAAVWTGDNIASWEHLKISIPMCLTLAISGVSNCGADVGGFVGDVTEELLQRWYQTGAWLPFFRAHSSMYVERREPYLFNEDVQKRIRNAIRERYYHLPLWYTLFFEHEKFLEPVIRPLSYHYSDDVNTLEMDDQFLVGRDVLVHPITDEDVGDVKIYLPGGVNEFWYDIVNEYLYYGVGYETVKVDLDSLPVFYRGGSILARLEEHRASSQFMHDDSYTVYVFLDKNNYAEGNLYFDDYESFDYLENKFKYFKLIYNNIGGLIINDVDDEGEFDRLFKIAKLIVYRHPASVTKNYSEVNVNGASYKVEHVNDYRFEVNNLNVTIGDDFQMRFY